MDLILKRGDVVVCVLSGDYGKPRPAVIVQSDLFNATHASITICPITSHLIEASLFRLALFASEQNGLNSNSQIMVDKIATLQRDKVRQKIGALSNEQIIKLDQAIKMWLNISE